MVERILVSSKREGCGACAAAVQENSVTRQTSLCIAVLSQGAVEGSCARPYLWIFRLVYTASHWRSPAGPGTSTPGSTGFIRFHLSPHNVVLPIECHGHKTGVGASATEPVHGFARHHRHAARRQKRASHSLHGSPNASADHDQLFLSCVVMGWDIAPGITLQEERRRSGLGVSIFQRTMQALDVVIDDKSRGFEGRNDAMSDCPGTWRSSVIPRGTGHQSQRPEQDACTHSTWHCGARLSHCEGTYAARHGHFSLSEKTRMYSRNEWV